MPIPVPAAGSRLFLTACLLAFVGCAADAADDSALRRGSEDAEGGEDGSDAEPERGEGTEVSGLQQPILGSNSCQNADLRIVNNLDFPITVRSIDYYNGSEGRWQHEDLSNQQVSPGAMEFWTPSLSNTKDDLIYSFDVNFDHDEDANGGPIATHAHDYHVNVPDQRCNTGVVYLLEIQ